MHKCIRWLATIVFYTDVEPFRVHLTLLILVKAEDRMKNIHFPFWHPWSFQRQKSHWESSCYTREYKGQQRTGLNVSFVEHFTFTPMSLLNEGSSSSLHTHSESPLHTLTEVLVLYTFQCIEYFAWVCSQLPPSSCLWITDVCLALTPFPLNGSCWIPAQALSPWVPWIQFLCSWPHFL